MVNNNPRLERRTALKTIGTAGLASVAGLSSLASAENAICSNDANIECGGGGGTDRNVYKSEAWRIGGSGSVTYDDWLDLYLDLVATYNGHLDGDYYSWDVTVIAAADRCSSVAGADCDNPDDALYRIGMSLSPGEDLIPSPTTDPDASDQVSVGIPKSDSDVLSETGLSSSELNDPGAVKDELETAFADESGLASEMAGVSSTLGYLFERLGQSGDNLVRAGRSLSIAGIGLGLVDLMSSSNDDYSISATLPNSMGYPEQRVAVLHYSNLPVELVDWDGDTEFTLGGEVRGQYGYSGINDTRSEETTVPW